MHEHPDDSDVNHALDRSTYDALARALRSGVAAARRGDTIPLDKVLSDAGLD